MSGIQKRVSPSKGLRYRWVRDPNGFLFYSVVIDQHDDRQLLFFSFSSSVLLLLLLLNKKRNHKARCASFRVTDIRLTRLYWCLSPVKERELFRTTDLLQQQVFLSLFFSDCCCLLWFPKRWPYSFLCCPSRHRFGSTLGRLDTIHTSSQLALVLFSRFKCQMKVG